MKKSSTIVVIVIVLAVLVGGGYALFHKAPYKAPAAAATSPATTTSNAAVIVTKSNASLGQYLATSNGQALYTFGGDSNGMSKCTGSCLASWPAYVDKGATTGLPANVGTIKRTDNGATQFTYNGMPLYTFVGDSNGQVTGNGVSNFTVAKPAASSTSTTPAPASSQPSATYQSTTTPSPSPAPSQSTSSTTSNTSSGSGW